MAKYCNFIKLLFLLLLVSEAPPAVDTRPARALPSPPSDLIAGNEFLKLFLERDEQRRDLRSTEGASGSRDGGDAGGENDVGERQLNGVLNGRGGSSARSLDYHGRNANANAHSPIDDKQQVVKLVTSGSKIVFLEEYDDDDAVVDAVAREIDLQRESTKSKVTPPPPPSPRATTTTAKPATTTRAAQRKLALPPSGDEVKVVAVSVSSSKRASSTHQRTQREKPQYKHDRIALSTTTTTPPTFATTSTPFKTTRAPLTSNTSTSRSTSVTASASLASASASASASATDFINRSHKSEFSIEEVEPLTMSQRKRSKASSGGVGAADSLTDSAHSASTNVQNIIAAPVTATSADKSANASAVETAEKLLPFQTVIYHDTKEGHGPQSRSISYSSISQNVEDLHSWRDSQSILAEAQRNVSESLVPMPRAAAPHTSEPAKFYSVPAKMYGVPSKFYSEPAKVYSEPAKVYGQPEKFYSEPAKVYGQPSKFYSEPAKVYSQPAKVYGEPAKSYWPQTTLTTTSTTTTTTTKSPPTSSTTMRTTTLSPFQSRRQGALGSRTVYGGSSALTTTTVAPPTHHTNVQGHSTDDGSYHHHQHHHYHNHHYTQQQRPHQAPSRPRPLFNLDKLPYDLLNAPEPPTTPPTASFESERVRQRPCYDGDAQQQPQQFRRQYSSATSSQADQHSNQNAKGLPNGDLVKCVAKYANSAAATATGAGAALATSLSAASHYTTERSRSADEDLYTPTPEQNYEIEESVSVMTNGRAHGVQGGAAATTTAAAMMMRQQPQQPTRNRVHFGLNAGYDGNTNANANVGSDGGADESIIDDAYNNQNSNNNNQQHGYNYDDDYETPNDAKSNNGNGDDNDDSKVAYVVEGRNYRKYRVEEKTDDGFIVGEYGVVDHNDGNLRGVRYTADSTVNHSLIQKALLTFLKLK